MTNSTELTVLGQSVQSLYTQYSKSAFIVNRRYQRKLVWAVEEKQSLIDSVRNNLPIPLILLAEGSAAEGARFEIIDGLQRLNAIFSFLENEFPFDGAYFDLETLADTKYKRDQKELKQKTPVLGREQSLAIVNYQLPISTYRSASEESVDEVFRRINSSGRKLSLQEIRQAGVTSEFAGLVRRISAAVRKDATLTDLVALSEMPKISITSGDLPYGINSDDVFWVKNGILDREAVRESRDEELVLDILLDLILDPVAVSGTAYRNSAYGRESNAATSAGVVDARINTLGAEEIEKRFVRALEVIRNSIDSSATPWAGWVITQQNPRGVPRYFQAIFVSISELISAENLEVADLSGLTSKLRRFWDQDLSIPAGGGTWGANRKRPLFDAVKAQLRPFFKSSDNPVAARTRETAVQFETELQMALTEHALFELKQGFTRLDGTNDIDDSAFESVLQTAGAMANVRPGAHGFIFFGVADKVADADRIKAIYGVDAVMGGEYLVTGTQHELRALQRNRDEHLRWLVQRIKSSKLEAGFAAQLAASVSLFEYKGYLVWSLRPQAGAGPTSWDGRFYTRHGNSTVEAKGADLIALMRQFS